MGTNRWRHWLKGRFGAAEPRLRERRQPRSSRLGIEELERRVLPAAYVVNSPGDDHDGNPFAPFSDTGPIIDPMTGARALTGLCTLRSAIENADAHGVPATITFAIPGMPVIHTTGLPTVFVPITIDGTSQAGYDPVAHTPVVQLTGFGPSTPANGLTIAGPGSTVKALVIYGFAGSGILLQSSDNHVEDNFIGTNPTGTMPGSADGMGNAIGVTIQGNHNTIGGLMPAQQNLISGNTRPNGGPAGSYGIGVYILPGRIGNLVEGDYIGTNKAGTGSLSNLIGVRVSGMSNTVGAAAAPNVISANHDDGVWLDATAAMNLVDGNAIGTTAAGTAALGNGVGVYVLGPGNAVGGPLPAPAPGGPPAVPANVVSGNLMQGVLFKGAAAAGSVIQGNYIGTNKAGTAALANGGDGVAILMGANACTVGGPAGKGNLISGNRGNGVRISDAGTNGNLVQGNYIGTDHTGTASLGNGLNGVQIAAGANTNKVGGPIRAGVGNVVSGNGSEGVSIVDAGTNANLVQGNYIGTDASGSHGLGNHTVGVCVILGGANNVIGGAGAGNVISDSVGAGVLLGGAGTTGNLVQGNYIGTDVSGSVGLGNGGNGVTISGGADTNTVGGVGSGLGNLISDNAGDGVSITGSGTTANLVQGNLIGTDINGTTNLGNGNNGVLVGGFATANQIGGTGGLNLISGNGNDGVRITDGGTFSNQVLGNYIGTDLTGIHALGNAVDGVEILNGASGNLIAQRNVISGNRGVGVRIAYAGTAANLVQGNYIGTDYTGSAAVPNTSNGVQIALGATSNFVGGTLASQRNVISGNGGDGVRLNDEGTNMNVVTGNYIGTNAAGSTALANFYSGVEIFNKASNNRIGGTVAGEGNVVSGNGVDGVHIENVGTTSNLVQGNAIGTDPTGAVALANVANGVEIDLGASATTIGGTLLTAGNVVSGNGGDGILISDAGTTGNLIEGNYVGTDISGGVVLGNVGNGIEIHMGAAGNSIGGVGAGNLISGNTGHGVLISGAGTTMNLVAGNMIGTDISGTLILGNLGNGVTIVAGAAANTVGGTMAGLGNVVSGNGGDGVYLSGMGTTGNLIQRNFIGTDLTGTVPLTDPTFTFFQGNIGHGVWIAGGASGNTVGGTAVGAGNVIAFNGLAGVAVVGATSTGDSILGNSIFANVGLGIDLGDDGVTPNGPNPAVGPNDWQNYPVLSSATVTAGTTTITGMLTSAPSTTFRIEFFASAAADPSGYGQGATYLGFATVTTDAMGVATIAFSFAADLTGMFISATATDPSGNTSEFSFAIPV